MLPAVLGVSEPIIRTRVRIVSPYPYPLPYPYTEQDGGGAYSGHTTHSGAMERCYAGRFRSHGTG